MFSFSQPNQWAISNALQQAPSNGVSGLDDYAMYASTNNQWTRSASQLISSSKTKPCQWSSVEFRNVALYTI